MYFIILHLILFTKHTQLLPQTLNFHFFLLLLDLVVLDLLFQGVVFLLCSVHLSVDYSVKQVWTHFDNMRIHTRINICSNLPWYLYLSFQNRQLERLLNKTLLLEIKMHENCVQLLRRGVSRCLETYFLVMVHTEFVVFIHAVLAILKWTPEWVISV